MYKSDGTDTFIVSMGCFIIVKFKEVQNLEKLPSSIKTSTIHVKSLTTSDITTANKNMQQLEIGNNIYKHYESKII